MLNAAGAGLGALILTGQEALSTKVNPEAIDLPLRELGELDGAAHLADALDSRLFASRGIQRFSYAHRAIGEFLGAYWLAQAANSPRKKRRILELFNGHALVPASLRGIHAWLAWHSPALADEIIAADPMGIIEYGDAGAARLCRRACRCALAAHPALSGPVFWQGVKDMELKHIDIACLSISSANMRGQKKAPDLGNILPSIRARGILVPLIVRRNGSPETYEIVAGIRPQ